MSRRELRRVEVLVRVKSKELNVADAASLLGVIYRQGKRLWKRYREGGSPGLKQGSAGRGSARAKPVRFRRRVMKLVREQYGEGEGERFGPTLAAEHWASEDGMRIAAETLRRWMLKEGLWSRRRKRKPYRQRRERRRHFGELVQMDGSFHDWLEERGPGGCMMNMTDDATSEVELRLGEEETIGAAANTCGPGSKNTECRRHCTWTGKTCINARRHSANSCGARSRSRNSGECARSWESRSLRLGRRRPRGEWSAHPSLGIVVEFPHSVSPRQEEDTQLSCQWLDPKRPTVSIIPAKRSNCVRNLH
jgi:hypothetical protein